MSSVEDLVEKDREYARRRVREWRKRNPEKFRGIKRRIQKKQRKILKLIDKAASFIYEKEGIYLDRPETIALLFYYYGFMRYGSKVAEEKLRSYGLKEIARIHPRVAEAGKEKKEK